MGDLCGSNQYGMNLYKLVEFVCGRRILGGIYVKHFAVVVQDRQLENETIIATVIRNAVIGTIRSGSILL